MIHFSDDTIRAIHNARYGRRTKPAPTPRTPSRIRHAR